MIKLITGKAFSVAITVNNEGIITDAPGEFAKFINQPLQILLDVLKKNKFQLLTTEDVEET